MRDLAGIKQDISELRANQGVIEERVKMEERVTRMISLSLITLGVIAAGLIAALT